MIEELRAEFSATQLSDLFLTWDEVRELSNHPLVTIGAHTLSHCVLSQETESDALKEINESKREIEEHIGKPCEHFAYPYGDRQAVGRRDAMLAQKAGFLTAVSTRSGHIFLKHLEHQHILPRLTIDFFDDLKRFKRKLNGTEAICTEPLNPLVTY